MARSTRHDRKLSRQQIILALCLAVSVGLLADFGGLIVKAYNLDQQAAAYDQGMARLAEENRELQSRLNYVRSDDYVRAAAAELFLWGEPGGRFLVPVDGAVPNSAPKSP